MAKARLLGTHTEEQWQALKKKWGFRCVKCWRREPFVMVGRDHIRAVCHGGSDVIENIQPLCRSCNSSTVDVNFMELRCREWTSIKQAMPLLDIPVFVRDRNGKIYGNIRRREWFRGEYRWRPHTGPPLQESTITHWLADS